METTGLQEEHGVTPNKQSQVCTETVDLAGAAGRAKGYPTTWANEERKARGWEALKAFLSFKKGDVFLNLELQNLLFLKELGTLTRPSKMPCSTMNTVQG